MAEFVIDGDVPVKIIVEEDGGNLKVTVSVLNSTGKIADLRGLFFDLSDESLLGSLSISGASVTNSQVKANGVKDLGNGNNLNGSVVNSLGAFDVGVSFGTPGIGKDDIQTASFTLSSSSGPLSADLLSEQDFGVRLTSVGDIGGRREDSLKLGGKAPDLGICDNGPDPSGFPGAAVLTGGDDLLPAGGSPGSDTVFGLAGNDTLYLGTGNDLAYAGAGNDSVFTGTGDDTVYGGCGNDWIDGQGGDDWLYGGEGNDRISANEGSDRLFGGNGDDTLVGGPDNDSVYGGEGRDTATGGLGDDFIYGGNGADNLSGGAGNDFLGGGAGNDTLRGEAGADTFEFAKGGGADRVMDYVVGQDRIDLVSVLQSDLSFSQTSEGLLIRASAQDSLLLMGLTLADQSSLVFV